jgi:hypothetical protein
MNRENFSFSSKVLLGDFLQPTVGEEYVRLSEEQVMKRVEELRLSRSFKTRSSSHRSEAPPLLLCRQSQICSGQMNRDNNNMIYKNCCTLGIKREIYEPQLNLIFVTLFLLMILVYTICI